MMISPNRNQGPSIKCDLCENPAIIFMAEIRSGQRIDRRFCMDCAARSDEPTVKELVAHMTSQLPEPPDTAE